MTENGGRRGLALGAVAGTMIVWGTTYVVTKVTVAEVPPLTLACLRFLIASAVLIPIAAVRGQLQMSLNARTAGPLLLMALTGVAGFTAAFNYALRYGSASQGALLYAFVPAAVIVAAWLGLGEKATGLRKVGTAISIVGAIMVAVGSSAADQASPAPLIGAAFMIAAVIAWAIYTVIAKRLADVDQSAVLSWVSLLGAAMLFPFAALELANTGWPTVSAQGLAGLLFLGIIASALAYLVYNLALRVLDAGQVGVFANFDPIVGVIVAFIVLHETLTLWQWFGGAAALVGMWLSTVAHPKTPAT